MSSLPVTIESEIEEPTEHLLKLYLRPYLQGDDAARFDGLAPRSGTGYLQLPLVYGPVEHRVFPEAGCVCVEPAWHGNGRSEAMVHDVPLGSLHVKLIVERPKYRCGSCRVQHSPWPNAFPLRAISQLPTSGRSPSRRMLLTERLFRFLVTNWAYGLTRQELGDATGLSSEQVSRALNQAHELLPKRLQPLPAVLGIDEVYLRDKYHTVITDLSRVGETRLVDIAPGRPEAHQNAPKSEVEVSNRGGTVTKVSAYGTPGLESDELAAAMRKLARQYASEDAWRDSSGRLATPILTSDGWWHFKLAMRTFFQEAAEEAGTQIGTFNYVADLFHLQRDLQKHAKTASQVIKSSAKRHLKFQEKAINQLHQRTLQMTAPSENHKKWIRAVQLQNAQQSTTELLKLLKLQDAQVPQDILAVFRQLHAFLRTELIEPAFSKASVDEWRQLLTKIFARLKSQANTENEAELDRAMELNKSVVRAGKSLLRTGSQTDFETWLTALSGLDEHPFARMKHGGFLYTALDRRFVGKRIGPHGPRRSRYLRELEQSARTRFIHTIADVTEAKDALPAKLYERALGAAKTLERSIAAISDQDAGFLKSIERLNQELAKYDAELFRIVRPGNSRTERLNRSIRLRLINTSSTTEFEELRVRLLCGLSGALHQTEPDPELPVFNNPPPTECPSCGHSHLFVDPNGIHAQRYRDVPIGWQPTEYVISTPKWKCLKCMHSPPGAVTRGSALNTPGLIAYLEELAATPRLVGLPVDVWKKRTGVPTAQLKPYLDGPAGFHTPTPDDPAIVIGLAATSDSYKDRRTNEQRKGNSLPPIGPRVLLADLRHRDVGAQESDSPLPARVIAHEHMQLEELIGRLEHLHELAGQQLVILVDDTIWYRSNFMSALRSAGHNETRWRIGIDGYAALGRVKQAARELKNYWLQNTRTRIIKSERRARSSTDTGEDQRAQRDANKESLSKFFTDDLNGLHPDRSHKELLLMLKPGKHATIEAGYSPTEILEIHKHLRAWWHIIKNTKNYDHSQLQEHFKRLHAEPWNIRSSTLKRVRTNFMQSMEQVTRALLNTKQQKGDRVLPDTKTADFNAARIQAIKRRIKLESARRGNQ